MTKTRFLRFSGSFAMSFTLLVAANPSFAAPTCESQFVVAPPSLPRQPPTFGKDFARQIPVAVVARTNFPTQWGELMKLAAAKLSPRDAKDLEEWILSSYFVDRPLVAVRPSKDARDMEWMWNNTGGRPIQNFFNAFREFVVIPSNGKELLADWKLMHGALMHYDVKLTDVVNRRHSLKDWVVGLIGGNVESIDTANIGRFRSGDVFFYAENNRIIDYKVNRFLTPGKAEDGRNVVYYPRLPDVAKFEDILSPALVAEIKAFNATKAESGAEKTELTGKMIEALASWAFAQHSARVKTAKTLDERVAAHVKLSHRLVSIHPFLNGNGRTSRFLLTALLAKEGLPPAILRDTWDVGLSVTQYTERVFDGISLSRAFLNDISLRIEAGMDPMLSPVLSLAVLPSRIYFDPGQAQVGKQYFPVDIYDFAQFTREQPTPDTNEANRFRSYMRYLKNWGVFNAKTMEPYQQKLVPTEMQQTFFNVDAGKPEVWQAKQDLFYRTEEIHRGLSTHESLTDTQLLSYFVEVQPISLSMNSSSAPPAGRKASIMKDFTSYNALLGNPKAFFQLAKDHMEATGQYSQSPLLSTALDRAVARRFAKGFLTSPQSILAMKGQLIVSAALPKYGVVELNRLHPVGAHFGISFVPKYPRQKEVSVAGALSADSIRSVEFTDVEVKSVGTNTGMSIAGEDTVVKSRRVVRRDLRDPSLVVLTKFDEHDAIVSQSRYRIVSVNGQPAIQKTSNAQ